MAQLFIGQQTGRLGKSSLSAAKHFVHQLAVCGFPELIVVVHPAFEAAVALLHDRGAFNLRRSVEQIAEVLGVSRFTVYNYLDRVDTD